MLTLICGRCRAGKTTYSKNFENVVHLDEVSMSGRERYPKVKDIVSNCTGDIVVEGVYEHKSVREELLRSYVGHGSKCIWLDTAEDVLLQRMDTIKLIVPRHFDPPTLDEGWDEIVIIRGGDVVGRYC